MAPSKILARKSERKGMEVTILSGGDRVFLQLATDKVMIRLPKTSKGKTTIENFHTAEVLERYPGGIPASDD